MSLDTRIASEDNVQVRGSGRINRLPLDIWISLILLLLFMVLPLVIYPIFVMKFLCFVLLAASFNLLLGYAGLMSFGHAAFFGCACYITGYSAKMWFTDAVPAIVLGTGAATLLGLIFGYLAIRRLGMQFAMITLALAQLAFFVFLQAPFTGGENGIQGIPRPTFLGIVNLQSDINMYYVVLVVVGVSMFAIWRIVNSPFGQILVSIRENEARATSLGYDIQRYKLAIFVMSAAFAGLAGSMKVLVFQFASLSDVAVQLSTDAIIMAVLGGVGTVWGPVAGAAIVVAMNSYFATWNFPITIIVGSVFMVCVLLFRRGIVGELLEFLQRRRKAQ